MNKAIKSLNLLAVIILITAILGCGSDGGGQGTTVPLTELDFAGDPSLRADPEKNLIVEFLEHPDSEKPESDTGEVGNDTIPYTYKRTLRDTFCWEDDDADAEHFMVLEDSEGNEIVRLDVNGECVTEVIVAGDYEMIINHDGRIEKTHPIFIIPEPNGDLGAKKEETIPEGILERAGRVLSKILEKLDISITQTTNAQSVQDNINTLLRTRSCERCDLHGADLSNMPLCEVGLFMANLTEANLFGTDLNGADLQEADLTRANLNGAFLFQATLFGTDLRGAALMGADLTEADLTEANLTEANLFGVTLTGAVLTRVTLSNTDFSEATWCDGTCICGDNSIDTCIGCPSIAICIQSS